MQEYLIIETDGFYKSSLRGIELALELSDHAKIHLWLLQDAVQLLQIDSATLLHNCFNNTNIKLYADKFSLVQRGCFLSDKKLDNVTVADMDVLSEQLMRKNTKAIWH
jgi:hypothetical protein